MPDVRNYRNLRADHGRMEHHPHLPIVTYTDYRDLVRHLAEQLDAERAENRRLRGQLTLASLQTDDIRRRLLTLNDLLRGGLA